MDDVILAGDVGTGDVIVLPDSDDAVLVKMVRLGQGGFIFTVAPVGNDSPAAEQVVTLTTQTRLRKRGRNEAH